MKKQLSIFKVKVQWGRCEQYSLFLVAATSPIVAKRVANKAATLPANMANIKVVSISGVIAAPHIDKPQVIFHL